MTKKQIIDTLNIIEDNLAEGHITLQVYFAHPTLYFETCDYRPEEFIEWKDIMLEEYIPQRLLCIVPPRPADGEVIIGTNDIQAIRYSITLDSIL